MASLRMLSRVLPATARTVREQLGLQSPAGTRPTTLRPNAAFRDICENHKAADDQIMMQPFEPRASDAHEREIDRFDAPRGVGLRYRSCAEKKPLKLTRPLDGRYETRGPSPLRDLPLSRACGATTTDPVNYVVTLKGGMYLGFDEHHSCLRAGQPVQAAGSVMFDAAKTRIVRITADTGHYRTHEEQLLRTAIGLALVGLIDVDTMLDTRNQCGFLAHSIGLLFGWVRARLPSLPDIFDPTNEELIDLDARDLAAAIRTAFAAEWPRRYPDRYYRRRTVDLPEGLQWRSEIPTRPLSAMRPAA